MLIKRFWIDPYQRTLDTRVVAVDGAAVRVAETICYAFSGGQESDRGTLAGFEIVEARKDGHDIVYTLPADHGLAVGPPVRMELDWPRRYRLMRLHFAAELVLELLCRLRPGVEKIGAHIAADKARIDFALDENVAALFPAIEAEVAAIVAADLAIACDFSDEAAQRRYWEIAGLARVPCGGTHPRRTGEIGPIGLRRRNVGRGKERIEVTLAGAG
ncbi:alanyl-tRNA editing protein [Chitinimonas koreensis]|uniref:alanyl-tRNA editing protein n=1 Tax=Chitinimonas koreensis TaxID=356302 RepID=UPI0003F9937A|nr:alanyl-tRNA editing protein [Chitinimonas koreensis]QNM95647.1 alanyl-tRNA editing protein [Chitinimonas koreensis]